MAEMLEIRWHGRGGQGAKTAAILLAEAAAAAGNTFRPFPSMGRSGWVLPWCPTTASVMSPSCCTAVSLVPST